MRMSWSGVSDRPRAIFSFLGPAGTSKTYMAKFLGQVLQGYKTLNLDMAQFNSEKEGFGLVGLRKGFTDAICQKRQSVRFYANDTACGVEECVSIGHQ